MWRVVAGIVVFAAGGVGSGSEYSGAGAGGRLPGAPSSVGGTYAGTTFFFSLILRSHSMSFVGAQGVPK